MAETLPDFPPALIAATPSPTADPTTVRYLGSKTRVVDDIVEIIGPPRASDGRLIDGFAGTGIVASRAADAGWSVHVNDHLLSAVCIASARLVAAEEASFAALGGYEAAIEQLNALPGTAGFFWSEYSPGSVAQRLYFTKENARKIDAMRDLIQIWVAAGKVSQIERRLLIADLISACARVANTAGTYGCFLTYWTRSALEPIRLEPRSLRTTSVPWGFSCDDVANVPVKEHDVVYLDPPYTKRQYAAYYHVNETLAHGDHPDVGGKTGLRPWQDRASDYCYKRRALNALTTLIAAIPARQVFLSYSSEGHVALDALRAGLEEFAEVKLHELARVGRYRPNPVASAAADDVTEVLLDVSKPLQD
jgi:adenine-specific DNA-methyltransferase